MRPTTPDENSPLRAVPSRCIPASIWLMGTLLLQSAALTAEPGLLVDLNPDNDRKDVLSARGENWRVVGGTGAIRDGITREFGEVSITIRHAGDAGSGLTEFWWKAGYDFEAARASDGLTVKDGDRGGQVEMVIRGLKPGLHTIVTFHNSTSDKPISPFEVSVDGRVVLKSVKPSVRVLHDDDAATAFVEVDAVAGKDVVLRFTPDGSQPLDNIVLSGFAIDRPDPQRQASRPVPSDGDGHVVEQPVLTWRAAAGIKRHHAYLGTKFAAVARATPESPEFRGTIQTNRFETKNPSPPAPLPASVVSSKDRAGRGEEEKANGLSVWPMYYWRVDEVGEGDSPAITKGNVWSFRVRRLAFPGAEGHGRFARGGRGGRVIEVTNLDDAGPGSLRAAVDAEGPRTVVFRVGGTIKLNSKILIRNPDITIAGQTAPGDGICVRGHTFGCFGTHDVILRHVRIRVGDESQQTQDGTGFASTSHAIFDHCSVSWSIDEGVSSRGAGPITFQRCIVAEALNIANHKKYEPGKGHSFAGSISGNVGSFHHNLVAHCAGRNWSLAGGLNRAGKFAGYLDIRNNVVFNWATRTNDGGVKKLNLVNNLYIPGPATRVFHLLKPDAGSPEDPQQYFVSGNVMEGRPQYDADNWLNGATVVDPALVEQIKLTEPFCESFVTTHSAREAYDSVMTDVGANLPRHDAVDQRIIADVLARRTTAKGSRGGLPGIIDTQTDVGGWPELKGGPAPVDTDHDGMPDDWERSHGLNSLDDRDGNADRDGDDYTNLEEYLNSVARRSAP